MKQLVLILGVGLMMSCVPIKKYKDLEANYNTCQEEQALFKTRAIDFENQVKELNVQVDLLRKNFNQLQADTARIGNDYRQTLVSLAQTKQLNNVLEKKYTDLISSGSAQNASLVKDLENTRLKLQQKEDRLNEIEKELVGREKILALKEKRIDELESMLANKDEAAKILKNKIASALRGFADKGITVEEKDGKIYVSMEAQLLFPSGKTSVNQEGQRAIIDLANVLQGQEGINILVEGHTDTDLLKSAAHPTDNWELSVLRATAVVKIMLANSEMSPRMVSASGRSEFYPVDPANKAKNRRIEIIITPDLSELFELISPE